MAEIQSAAFTVSVDNEAEIRAWLDQMGKARDALERSFNDLLTLCQTRPLIAMSINRSAQDDGGDRAD